MPPPWIQLQLLDPPLLIANAGLHYTFRGQKLDHNLAYCITVNGLLRDAIELVADRSKVARGAIIVLNFIPQNFRKLSYTFSYIS